MFAVSWGSVRKVFVPQITMAGLNAVVNVLVSCSFAISVLRDVWIFWRAHQLCVHVEGDVHES